MTARSVRCCYYSQHTVSFKLNDYIAYVDADFPTEVPLRLDAAALTHKWHSDLSTYDITSDDAWDSLFPIGNGWVSLGPGTPKRKFAMTMYHQLHCLNALRTSYLTARAGFPENATFPDTSKMADYHFRHCLNYLREMVLCAADTTLEYPEMDITHRCRDWTQLRQWVESNYEEFDVRAKADSMIVEE